MIEACAKGMLTESGLGGKQGVVEAFVLAQVKPINKDNIRCYNCGELGHIQLEYHKVFLKRHTSTSCPSSAYLE